MCTSQVYAIRWSKGIKEALPADGFVSLLLHTDLIEVHPALAWVATRNVFGFNVVFLRSLPPGETIELSVSTPHMYKFYTSKVNAPEWSGAHVAWHAASVQQFTLPTADPQSWASWRWDPARMARALPVASSTEVLPYLKSTVSKLPDLVAAARDRGGKISINTAPRDNQNPRTFKHHRVRLDGPFDVGTVAHFSIVGWYGETDHPEGEDGVATAGLYYMSRTAAEHIYKAPHPWLQSRQPVSEVPFALLHVALLSPRKFERFTPAGFLDVSDAEIALNPEREEFARGKWFAACGPTMSDQTSMRPTEDVTWVWDGGPIATGPAPPLREDLWQEFTRRAPDWTRGRLALLRLADSASGSKADSIAKSELCAAAGFSEGNFYKLKKEMEAVGGPGIVATDKPSAWLTDEGAKQAAELWTLARADPALHRDLLILLHPESPEGASIRTLASAGGKLASEGGTAGFGGVPPPPFGD